MRQQKGMPGAPTLFKRLVSRVLRQAINPAPKQEKMGPRRGTSRGPYNPRFRKRHQRLMPLRLNEKPHRPLQAPLRPNLTNLPLPLQPTPRQPLRISHPLRRRPLLQLGPLHKMHIHRRVSRRKVPQQQQVQDGLLQRLWKVRLPWSEEDCLWTRD
jgi:hypothetical protein